LTLTFDLPKHDTVPHTIDLTGSATKRQLTFSATQNLQVYATDRFVLPIYAETDLTPYCAAGYAIRLSYDSLKLKLVDVNISGTLTPQGTGFPYLYPSTPPGRDTV